MVNEMLTLMRYDIINLFLFMIPSNHQHGAIVSFFKHGETHTMVICS